MLQSIRKGSRTWVGVILAVFMMLLFGVWGLEDFIRGGFNQASTVITVGDVKVTAREFQNSYQNAITRLQQQTKRSFDYQTAKRMGIVNQVALQFVQDAIYRQELTRLGLRVSDGVIRNELYAIRAFQDATGKFDRQRFLLYLQQAQVSQDQIFADLALQTGRRFLLTSVGNFETAPKAYMERLYKFRNESRVAEVVTVDASTIKDIPTPTDDDLKKFVDANKAAFTAPEFRTVQALIVRPADLYKQIKVDSAEVKKIYEADKATKYTTPEKREVHQITFTSEDEAKKAYAALVGGKTFETVGKEFSKTGVTNMGLQEKSAIPIPALRDPAFKMKTEQVSEPIKSKLAWHIIKVVDIEPENVKPLEAVEAGIVEELRKKQVVPLLTKLRDELDDQLGGGFKFDDIAKRLKIKLVTLTVDARGRNEDGQAVKDVPNTLIGGAFRLAKGEVGDIVDMTGGGFYVARVDTITPSQVPPLEKVRTRATIEWKRAEVDKLAKKKAEEMAAAIRKGEKLEDVAEKEKLEVKVSQPQTRGTYDATGRLDGTLESAIFAAKEKGVFLAKVPGGWAVGQVTQINQADMKDAGKEVEEIGTTFKKSAEEATVLAFWAALQKRYEVNIDMKAIDAIFERR